MGRMRYDLFEKLDHLPISYLDRHSSGDLMSRMTNDIENISSTISQSLGSLVSGILTIAGTIAIMFWYCWQLTLITLVTVILTVLVTKWMSAKMRQAYRGRATALGILNGHGEEMITGYHSVAAYNRQSRTKEEFNALSDRLTREGIRAEVLGGSMGPLMNCISNLGFVIVAAFGGYFALEGLITIGVISAFIIYAKQFSRPLNEIAQLYGSVQTAMAGAERVFALLDQPDEDNGGTRELGNMAGNISFRHVDFSYEPGKPILADFNLEVRSGQKVALVGATGSGKTTVVNLLMRFYPVDAGEICIDGVNIMELRRDWLRHNTAIVLQDTVLFSDTIADNIKYARSGRTGIGDGAGGGTKQLRPLHPPAEGGLSDCAQAGRDRTFPRAAAAAEHCPCHPGRPEDSDFGRSHLLGGYSYRAEHSGCAGKADEKSYQPNHCPSPVYYPGCRFHCGHGSWKSCRNRKTSAAPGKAGRLLWPVYGPVRRKRNLTGIDVYFIVQKALKNGLTRLTHYGIVGA